MTNKKFDPKKFIDREPEQQLFKEFLQLKDRERILSICDVGGSGKSHLLEMFNHLCRTTKPRIPVSLVALDQLPGDSPLDLVKILAQHLSYFEINCHNFMSYNSARVSKDFAHIRSSIYLQGANFAQAKDTTIAGSIINTAQIDNVNITNNGLELTPEQEGLAEDVCLEAFWTDIKGYCEDKPIVFMLDAYEKCPDAIKTWIEKKLLERFFGSENKPKHLLMVIAGREIPQFTTNWPSEDCEAIVKSPEKLGRWTKEHVEECLRIHGVRYQTEHLDVLHRLVNWDLTPSLIVQVIQTIATAQ